MAEPIRYPPVVKFIVGNEAAERFSFYGMRALLTLYMVNQFAMPQRDAKAWYHWFMMATYLTPLVGGWIADRFWGRYRTILWVSLGYVAGHAVISLWETPVGLLVGCTLVAVGAGGIKPCVAAFVGDQFPPSQQTLMARVYGWFYWSVNLGSASAYLFMPILRVRHGYAVAFAVPGVFMALALGIFWLGRHHYQVAPPSGPAPHGFLRVVGSALRRIGTGAPGAHWLDTARALHPADAVEGAKAVVRIMGVFASVILFWALFDQKSAAWVLQARQMDLQLGPLLLTPEQIQVANPFLVMTLIPLLTVVVFPALERRGVRLTPLRKMGTGMFVTVLSFAAAALVQSAIDATGGAAAGGPGSPSVLWQAPQYLLLTTGEVLVSVTALEFSYTQAPKAMRSTIMSLWYLAVALGNLLTAVVIQLVPLSGAAYFWFFAGLMLVAAVAFRFVARRYEATPAPAPAPAP